MFFQFSDFVSLIAVSISILTFLISLYFQFIKPPKLIITPGEDLILYYYKDKGLVIRSHLSFFNLGARYLGIRKIVGNITRKTDGYSTDFEWIEFFKIISIVAKDKSEKPWSVFDRPLNTIIVPGYQGVNQSVTFSTLKPFEITPGLYELNYIAYTMPIFKKPFTSSCTVRIEKEAAEYLHKNCTANEKGVYKDSLKLRLNP